MNRWLQVALASLFINISYGTLSYSFSVFVTDGAAGGAFGKGTLSLAFAVALLVSGVAAITTGAVADRLGSRRLMAGGSILGAAALCLFAAVQQSWQLFLVLPLAMGPAMAATFYEPVYVLMNRWFTAAERPRAYGLLTMMSGVSITIFTPLTQALVDAAGWRVAALCLAAILLVVGTAVPLLLNDAPRASEARMRPGDVFHDIVAGVRFTTAPFWVFTIAFFFATAAFSGFGFHMVAQLESRGFEAGGVAAAVAITGLVSLPGRFLLPSISARAGGNALLAVCLVLLAASAIIASSAQAWWQVWVYVGLNGLVFGAVYPLRALATSEGFAGPFFGRIIGIQALFVAVGRALGPAAIALIGTDRAGYETGFRMAALVLLVAALAGWWAMRHPARPAPGRDPV
ncbi:MAG: MFS transporter [Dehalococcoidia bacterium]